MIPNYLPQIEHPSEITTPCLPPALQRRDFFRVSRGSHLTWTQAPSCVSHRRRGISTSSVSAPSCLQFIRDGGHTSSLALWGRSMGAVTAILYSERDPSVAGIVLDSPFSRLTDLMKELVEEQNIPLWGLVGGTALKLMRRCAPPSAPPLCAGV